MNCSRRDLCLWLPAFLAARNLFPQGTSLPSKALAFDDLTVHTEGGNSFRPILEGLASDGSHLEVHETDLAQGAMPHPPHHHRHEEMFLIREGTVEVSIAGRITRLGPGSAAFVASNEEHSIKNVGLTHAQYFVIALGSDK
jgi:mannose-6-phosphate isomerase-like protein (cupin superfamily)